jgi:hypothetical protein
MQKIKSCQTPSKCTVCFARRRKKFIALNWLRVRRNTILIIGARKLAQLTDNLDCVKWSLTAKQFAQLNAISQIEPGFPRDFLDKPFVRDYLHGGLFDRIKR